MDATETAVSQDVGSATTETTSSPDTSTTSTSTTASPASNSTGKSYTEQQLQEILRARVEQQKRSYEKRLSEFEKERQEYRAVTERLNKGFEQFGRGLGFIQDEQPKYLTEQDVQSRLEQFKQEMLQREEQQERSRIYQRISGDWRQVQAEVKDWADMPGFKQAWAEQWSPDKDPMAIAKEIASFYEKKFASRQNAAATVKEDRARVVPVKPSTPTPSATAKDAEKLPLRKRIIAAQKAARGD
jgi:Cdc6-like AAA superfamily ATPase